MPSICTSVASVPVPKSADIGQVAGAGEQRHRLAVAEAGRGDDEIVEMARPHPGIIGDEGIAFVHRLDREVVEKMLHRFGHRVDMAGRAGHRLGVHPPVEPEDAGGEVATLAHDRAERRVHQSLRLFFDDRDQAVPHDLQSDGVDTGGAHQSLSPLRSITI